MLVLHHEWGAVHIGHNMKEYPGWYDELNVFFHTKFLAFMMFNRGFYPVFDAWLKNRHREFGILITMFDGHAAHRDKQWWMCANDEYDIPVQQFVDEHDGSSLLILLLCCNPRNRGRITSRKSLVVYSRSAMTPNSMESRRSRQLLHIPDHGDFIGTTDEAELNKIAHECGYKPSLV